MKNVNFECLVGKTFSSIKVDKVANVIYFECTDGTKYLMEHDTQCCEDVHIEDIDGDIQRLIGSTILLAEESSDYKAKDEALWTFYKLSTVIDSVTIRWVGITDSCYAIDVSFYQT